MLRAVVLAARLEFTIDEPMLEAIAAHRHEIAHSAPARLVEEYYKILRSGHAEEALRQLRTTGLLKAITPELAAAGDELWRSIARARSLSRAVRRGARHRDQRDPRRHAAPAARPRRPARASRPTRSSAASSSACCRLRGATSSGCSRFSRCSRGCWTSQAAPRTQRGLLHRAVLNEAITWLEIHGDHPDVVAHWRALQADDHARPSVVSDAAADVAADTAFPRRRKRRRRRRGAPRVTGNS